MLKLIQHGLTFVGMKCVGTGRMSMNYETRAELQSPLEIFTLISYR